MIERHKKRGQNIPVKKQLFGGAKEKGKRT